VDLSILPSNHHSLQSTSIPLLWNTQVSDPTTRFDANSIAPGVLNSGCGDFTGAQRPLGSNLPGPIAAAAGIPQPGGLPGYPYVDPSISMTAPSGFLPIMPGVDDINNVVAGKAVGSDLNVGGNPQPFPYTAQSTPGGFVQAPSPKDTVLRTNALSLGIAPVGTPVKQDNGGDAGVNGSQNIVIGKSGGQANLFGNIPGKQYGIDVTVSLKTRINSILRVVDQDSFGTPLITGGRYPAGIFNCRQIWTGGIDNYIPSVRLAGNLRIAPGITSSGKLRIAKATVSSLPGSEARFAVAACLAPYAGFDVAQNNSDTATSAIPAGNAAPGYVAPTSALPANTAAARAAPTAANCNDTPTKLVADSGLAANSVQSLAPTVTGDGYTVTNSGASVSVAADLNVSTISLDVLIGDVAP
jgi:hypothetical protein